MKDLKIKKTSGDIVKEAMKGIREGSRKLPDFINTTEIKHYTTWNIICENNDIFYKLATSGILDENKVLKFVNKFSKNIDDIFNFDSEYGMEYIKYFNDREENIKEWLHYGEIYEGLANFQKFDDVYLKKLRGEE